MSNIVKANVIEALIHVLQTGISEEQENAAVALHSLSVFKDKKIRIGNSGAICPLVELLGNGTPRGKKYAAKALLQLSTCTENRIKMVRSGALKNLIDLMDPATGMVDSVVVLLAKLASDPEGREAIAKAGGIPLLVEVVELGSPRGKENALAALVHFCKASDSFGVVKHLIDLMDPATGMVDRALVVLANLASDPEGKEAIAKAGGIPLLVDAVELGSPRGKENAAAALVHFCEPSDSFGVVKHLIDLMNPATGMADRALVVLDNLASDWQGREAISKAGGIPLVEALKLGSPRGKENAAAALLHFCTSEFYLYCRKVSKAGAIPPLEMLSKSGTPRAKEKADMLLRCLRVPEGVKYI